jgi:hypothetical protein
VIDLRGLAYNSGSSTVSWTQKTSGANASGTLTIKEGTQTQSFTLIGTYTTSNFSATSDGHGGTLITDPPVISGGSVDTATRNNIPSVYSESAFAREGGLLSYGVDQVDTFRRSATYVDRILRGAKPGDLPVQFPVKFEMVVNLKTAKSLGLTVPQSQTT